MNKYYKELVEICKKHGLNINEKSLMVQRLFGKCGEYEPIYEPRYVSEDEEWSKNIANKIKADIEDLSKRYGRYEIALVKYDDIDLRSSIILMSECYGWRKIFVEVRAQ